jgi:hypothetical protein
MAFNFYIQFFCFVCYAVQILSRTVQNSITFFMGGVKAIPKTALLLSKITKIGINPKNYFFI